MRLQAKTVTGRPDIALPKERCSEYELGFVDA
jgi:hypothetical protein